MAAQICELSNNFLMAAGYQLILPRFPLTQYYSQTFQMPDIALPSTSTSNPMIRLPLAGDKMEYMPLQFTFIVDEKMENYKELYGWMTSIAYDTSYDKYNRYPNKAKEQKLGEQDVKVVILSGKNNAVDTITFYDAIPIAMSGFPMTQQGTTTEFVQVTATFDYSYFNFDSITKGHPPI